mgnify:CR=1 FL=1
MWPKQWPKRDDHLVTMMEVKEEEEELRERENRLERGE